MIKGDDNIFIDKHELSIKEIGLKIISIGYLAFLLSCSGF